MASEVYFTNNPGEYQRLEGLYVTEKKPPGFIRGRNLNTPAFAGGTVRGPTTPQKITSPARYLEVYGGRDFGAGGPVIGKVWQGLLNKAFSDYWVRRVAAEDAEAGTVDLVNGATHIVKVDASSVGQWSTAANGGPTQSVEDASDGDATHWNLRVKYLGKEVVYENINTTGAADNLEEVIGDDLANLVVVTKLAAGRPTNVADVALVGGDDGAVATTDYIAAITDLSAVQGPAFCMVVEAAPEQDDLNGAIVTLSATVKDRGFLVWSGSTSNSPSAEITAKEDQIGTVRDRVWWCFNAPKTLDPETGAKAFQGPHLWMASILANTDVDIHPGAHENAEFCAGIAELQNETLTRGDLIDLRAAGISTLEKLPGEFLFRSAVATDGSEICDRRMKDFLQLSASDRLKFFVKSKNTRIVRAQEAAELIAFSIGLQSQGRIIDEDNKDGGPGFIVDNVSVNTTAQRGQGLEKILWRVRLIGHQLYLVLETEIGTGVVIEAKAA